MLEVIQAKHQFQIKINQSMIPIHMILQLCDSGVYSWLKISTRLGSSIYKKWKCKHSGEKLAWKLLKLEIHSNFSLANRNLHKKSSILHTLFLCIFMAALPNSEAFKK